MIACPSAPMMPGLSELAFDSQKERKITRIR
jgi:hypothetical protein